MTLEEAKKRIQESLKRSREDADFFGDYGSKGEITAYTNALSILKQVDTKPASKDRMTLTELAHELRKLFNFRYLTAEFLEGKIVALWNDKPSFTGYEWHFNDKAQCIADIRFHSIPVLNLSEYADAKGEIDFSKCIVEVE